WDCFAAGLCAGCAALLKPSGLAVGGALGLFLVIRPVRLLAMIAGVCVPVLVVLLYCAASDTLRDLPGLYRQISRYAAETAWDPFDLYKLVVVAALLVFPLM